MNISSYVSGPRAPASHRVTEPGAGTGTPELEAGGNSRDTVRQERVYPYVVHIIIVFIPNIHTQIKMKSACEISKLHI